MFESVMELTREQVQWLDECTKGTWALNPQTGLIDVKGGFNCSQQSLTDFKGVKFGIVDHSFDCSDNALTSLMGAPHEVDDSFYCSENQLTSLVGAPLKVGGYFYCYDNALTSLAGSPQSVRSFHCENNRLTSLVGAPREVSGSFVCQNNHLTSLVGAPLKVGGSFFDCQNNHLTSLEGAPLKFGGIFYCGNNPVSRETLKTIFTKMQKGTSYLAAVESLWSEIPLDDQVLLYADDFKWVSPEQSRVIVALRAYQGLRGML